jgi:hypothetical protein
MTPGDRPRSATSSRIWLIGLSLARGAYYSPPSPATTLARHLQRRRQL